MQPAKKEAHLFVCGQCGFESRKWLGRCPDCGAWDSLTEQRGQSTGRSVRKTATAQPLSGAVEEESARLLTNINEMDRVLGGGIVPGSLVLIGGDPGIGKSTLLLQAADTLAEEGIVLYVSGEESASQIKLRADRLGMKNDIDILCETDLDRIIDEATSTRCNVLIVD
ncbi:MAG: DNA repair protein RadA, partial [Clostridia bacterium]|nr:DNA repair protein RadA [Clostridia bacterium]